MSVIVTGLEMLSAAELRPKRCADPVFPVAAARIKPWPVNIFRSGFIDGLWAWWEKLSWRVEQRRAAAGDDRLRTLVASSAGSPVGFFELRRHADDKVESNGFGLAPAFIERGLGGLLLIVVLEVAWAIQPRRARLHACTIDHPATLINYLARSLKPDQIGVENDPPKPHQPGAARTSLFAMSNQIP